jgi:hypothetical protein
MPIRCLVMIYLLIIASLLLGACSRAATPGPTSLPPSPIQTATATSSPIPTTTQTPTLTRTIRPTYTSIPVPTWTPVPEPPVPLGLMDINAKTTVYDGTTWTVYNKDGKKTAIFDAKEQTWNYIGENIKIQYTIFGQEEDIGNITLPPEMTKYMPIDPVLMYQRKDANGNLVPADYGFVNTYHVDSTSGSEKTAHSFLVRFRGVIDSKRHNTYDQHRYYYVFEIPKTADKSLYILYPGDDSNDPAAITIGKTRDITTEYNGVSIDFTYIKMIKKEILSLMTKLKIGQQIAISFTVNDKIGSSLSPERQKNSAIQSACVQDLLDAYALSSADDLPPSKICQISGFSGGFNLPPDSVDPSILK